jgi:uncharacterized membrane protein HdeD (DUF308 family)
MTYGTIQRDILSKPWLSFLVFWGPGVAIAVTARSHYHNGLRTAVWTAALMTMGIACLVNAVRCHRVHCYLTGPFFLVMAVLTLMFGLGALPLRGNGWNILGFTILIGAVALCCLPELFLGKYRRKSAQPADDSLQSRQG